MAIHRHHRRQRSVRHGGADRSRGAHVGRRSATRRRPTSSATLRGKRVAFLARHGAGHRLLPSELNFRANIFGFKMLGVEYILSASAVGSLKEEYRPMDLVIPDQFFDRTRGRISHVLRARSRGARRVRAPVLRAAQRDRVPLGASAPAPPCTKGGTYVCMEGPQFSTLAESRLYRSWGMDIIGMTNLQEAKLAREAEICYTTIALVTDYDCWHPDHDSGDGRHDRRQPDEERADRAAGDRRRGREAAVRPRVRMCDGAQIRDHHEARGRARRHQARAGADCGKYLTREGVTADNVPSDEA